MKHFLLAFTTLVILRTPTAMSQPYQLGLEIYNPHFHNPALMKAEKTVQLDFIGYQNIYVFQSGLYANAIATLEKYNSSAGVRFAKTYIESSVSAWSIQLAYAYHHSFSDDLVLNGGFLFSSGQSEYFNIPPNSDNEIVKKRSAGSAGFGVSLNYRNLYTGISAGFPLYHRRTYLTADSSLVTGTDDAESYSFHFLSGYSLGRPGRLTFEPMFALDYRYVDGGRHEEWKAYFGANLEIRNLFGIGFTAGNLTSLSTSVNILDRVNLMIGIFSWRFDRDRYNRYEYIIGGSNYFDIIGQIRINL
jgi:hypothetical protein